MKFKNASSGFIAGFLFAISSFGLYQDFLGREGYAQYVLDHWVTGWISVPIEVATLIIALVLYNNCYQKFFAATLYIEELKKKIDAFETEYP